MADLAADLALAEPGDPKCGHVVGPVWKDGGESWACDKPAGHDLADGHAAWDADGKGGSWWVHEACRPEVAR